MYRMLRPTSTNTRVLPHAEEMAVAGTDAMLVNNNVGQFWPIPVLDNSIFLSIEKYVPSEADP
jgi:hypothetical protein